MITYDYTLEVDMGTEKKVHTPRLEMPKELKNIFRLQGPNSSGKSTLMNIIALGSHGLSGNRTSSDNRSARGSPNDKKSGSGKIPPSVISRMEELVTPGYKDLEFRLKIQDPVTGIILESSKKRGNPEIIVRESKDGGKTSQIIAADQFVKKYNLIYDIPENPIGRLNELTREINNIQNSFSNRIRYFQEYVEGISNELSGSMSPEEIKKLKDTIILDEESLKTYDLEPDRNRLNLLDKLKIAVNLSEYRDKMNDAETAFKSVDKEFKAVERKNSSENYNKKVGKLSKKLTPLTKEITNTVIGANKVSYPGIYNLRQLADEIPDDTKKIIENRGIPQAFIDEVKKLQKYLQSIYSPSKEDELRAMSEIIRVLRQYKNKNMDLPAIGPIDDVLKTLEDNYKQLDQEYNYSEIKKLEELTKTVLEDAENINGMVSDIQPPQKDDLDSFRKKNEYDSAKSIFDQARKTCSEYVRDISMPKGINLENLDRYLKDLHASLNDAYVGKTGREIEDIFSNERTKYNDLCSNRDKLKKELERNKKILDAEESKKTSPYSDYIEEIGTIKNEISELRNRFLESGRKLDAIENKRYGEYNSDDPFFHSVWTYLGKRLKSVRHLDKEYYVDEINLIEGIISASDGTIIRLSDMGTGQSQLSYLMGLLSADDDRMIIALFDEVSTMTDSTLEIIFNKLEEIQKEGKLMVGMAVSPANEISVKCYGL
jgi:exonuclease SbcC